MSIVVWFPNSLVDIHVSLFPIHYLNVRPVTTTEYIIANAPSPPIRNKPAVIVYHRRFQMDPAVMLTYHRRVVLRTGGDMLASPPGPFEAGGNRLSPPVRNKPAVMGRLR